MDGSITGGTFSGSPQNTAERFRYVAPFRFLGSQIEHLAERRPRLLLLLVAVLSVGLSCILAVSRRPWCDEAWFASPSYNLLHGGPMGMSLLDPHGFPFAPFVEGVDRFTFWVMPMYLLMQAFWYKLVGFSLFSMRSLSMVWAVVALCSWYYVVRHITASSKIGLLATLLLGIEHNFAMSGATGRMDMMCAALGLAAIALYLRLRQRFELAILFSATTLALSVFTHPNGLFAGIFVLILVLWFDRDKISVRIVLLAAVPFLLGGFLWGLYISRAPEVFFAQMAAQAKIPHRFDLSWNLLATVRDEVSIRYGSAYRLHDPLPLGLAAAIFYIYLGSAACAVAVKSFRSFHGTKVLLTVSVVAFLLLSCLQKNTYYLVFVIPQFTALVAVFLAWLWGRGEKQKVLAAALVVSFMGLQIGLISARVLRNDYRLQFLPVTEYLKAHSEPGDLILGSGELAFELGFDGRVIDDARLGYGSQKRADFIVLEHQYKSFWFRWLAVSEPKAYKYMVRLLKDDYFKVYDTTKTRFSSRFFTDTPYEIYQRKSSSEAVHIPADLAQNR